MMARVLMLQLASLACVMGMPATQGEMDSLVLVRAKREPSRSLTFSGFMPGSGMSAFASSDFSPYFRPRRPAKNPESWGPQEGRGDYPSEPSAVEHPPERGVDKSWVQPEDKGEEDGEAPPARPPKKNKKKYTPKETDEDEEEYEKPSRTGGNAAASFNAWFPIMLGMFPSSGGHSEQGEEGYSRGGQGGRDSPTRHTTVIANSVNYGRSGVASSHAAAYGGGPPPHTH